MAGGTEEGRRLAELESVCSGCSKYAKKYDEGKKNSPGQGGQERKRREDEENVSTSHESVAIEEVPGEGEGEETWKDRGVLCEPVEERDDHSGHRYPIGDFARFPIIEGRHEGQH